MQKKRERDVLLRGEKCENEEKEKKKEESSDDIY